MPSAHPDLIASVSGIRGIVGVSLTAEAALAFGQAFGTLRRGPIVVSRDSRPSGEMLADAVAAGLRASGCGVHPLSIAPTPTVGIAVRELGAAGGVQITASHNPAPYNGLKLFGPEGMVLAPDEGGRVLEVFRSGPLHHAAWDSVGGTLFTPFNPLRTHLARVLACVNAAAIQERQFRVYLDANHGAGGPLGLLLLAALGCHVVKAGCEPDGRFAHEPEPTEANLKDVAPQVRAEHCALGFVLDPDADRLALIDETGRYIGEELTLALAALSRLGEPGALAAGEKTLVVNMSTSRVMEDIAQRQGASFIRVPVGEFHVALRMKESGATLGGEGNGGVIDPRVGWVRDPFIGIALILKLMAERGKKLSELVAELPGYVIVKEKIPLRPEDLPRLYESLLRRWPEAKANRADGLRLDWPDRWLHVRPSNTESIVRVIAEAPNAAEAQELCDSIGRTKIGADSAAPL